ncbi:hypothetical protein [Roseovarius sp.]|uniref:hypothetical protein n=1 Tax=Roseovarius sp. TaxID=1486281 RepID=UPI003A97FE07
MTQSEDDNAQRGIAALKYQNRLLLAQVEELRATLATRDDEITRLIGRLLEQEAKTMERPGHLAWLRNWWR